MMIGDHRNKQLTANAFYSIFFLWLKPKNNPWNHNLLEQTLVLDGGLRKYIYDVVTLQPTLG